MEGYGHHPYFVEGDDPAVGPPADGGDAWTPSIEEIHAIQRAAREGGVTERPRWPMIVLRTPKGWTGPKEIDGKPVEGTWRSHQVPMGEVRTNAATPRRSSRPGCAATGPRSCSTSTAP